MRDRHIARGAVLALALAGCGGGGATTHPLGEEVAVEHTQISGSPQPKTTLGITVLEVRKGTQAELAAGGFTLDPDEKEMTPYYVDVRYRNQGSQAIERNLDVGLEDEDDNLITATTIISLGGPPFAKCPQVNEGKLAPGQSYESCTLFLVPEGREPSKVSFLPHDPGQATEFVYWAVE